MSVPAIIMYRTEPTKERLERMTLGLTVSQPLVVVDLNVRFTMKGMCVKNNNTHIYVKPTTNNRFISTHDLYCCLRPHSGGARHFHLGGPLEFFCNKGSCQWSV